MINAIKFLGIETVTRLVNSYATQLGVSPEYRIDLVCKACCDNPDLAPDMNTRRETKPLSHEQCVNAWVLKFINGYKNRISMRFSNPPSTVPDYALTVMLDTILPECHKPHIHQILDAHQLGMATENILGLLLEEFLFNCLHNNNNNNWAMAWGQTIKKVDFCNSFGALLQVKNRSNSENSSSKNVRTGTNIIEWHRINAETGITYWDNLLTIVGEHMRPLLNEYNFLNYIRTILFSNPNAIGIAPNNYWLKNN